MRALVRIRAVLLSVIVGAAVTAGVCLTAWWSPMVAPILAAEVMAVIVSYTSYPTTSGRRAWQVLRAVAEAAAVYALPSVGPWWTPLAMWAAAAIGVYPHLTAWRPRALNGRHTAGAAVLNTTLGDDPAPVYPYYLHEEAAAAAAADLAATVARIGAGLAARNPEAFASQSPSASNLREL